MIAGLDVTAFSALIETLYGAVQDSAAWGTVLALICLHLRTDSALVRFYNRDWSGVDFSVTHGFDPAYDSAYRQHFVHVDPVPDAVQRFPVGHLAFMDEVMPFERLKRTEFYNDYMRPQDKRYALGGCVYNENGAKAIFGVQRGVRGPPLARRERALLKTLTPHFAQALRLHQTLAGAQAGATAVTHAVDDLGIAAFFLDRSSRVCFSNARAEELASAGRLVTVLRGHLHARRRDRDVVLQKLIVQVTRRRGGALPAPGGAVQLGVLEPRSGTYSAVVAPWRGGPGPHSAVGPRVKAAVFIAARRPVALRPALLTGAYGLTPAEARLAARLVETCDLERTADALRVTTQTARDYLKAVFRKTDCHSQSELIRLILNSPAGLWGRRPRTSLDDD